MTSLNALLSKLEKEINMSWQILTLVNEIMNKERMLKAKLARMWGLVTLWVETERLSFVPANPNDLGCQLIPISLKEKYWTSFLSNHYKFDVLKSLFFNHYFVLREWCWHNWSRNQFPYHNNLHTRTCSRQRDRESIAHTHQIHTCEYLAIYMQLSEIHIFDIIIL